MMTRLPIQASIGSTPSALRPLAPLALALALVGCVEPQEAVGPSDSGQIGDSEGETDSDSATGGESDDAGEAEEASSDSGSDATGGNEDDSESDSDAESESGNPSGPVGLALDCGATRQTDKLPSALPIAPT